MISWNEIFKIMKKLTRSSLLKVFIAFVILVLVGSYLEFISQRSLHGTYIKNYFTAIWFTMETVTTVGYGDVIPINTEGKIIAMFIMISGIGLVGTLTATISAYLVQMKIIKGRPMMKKVKNHTIICNWNASTQNIMNHYENGESNDNKLIIVSNLEKKPQDLQNIEFVSGDCTSEDDLKNAGIADAKRIIILSDTENKDIPSDLLDAKTLLSIFTVRKLKSDIEIIAEIKDEKNKKHAVNAGADQVISLGELSSLTISKSISNPGISDFIIKILSEEDGPKAYSFEIDNKLAGKTISDIEKKLDGNGYIISVISRKQIVFPINPDFKLSEGDDIIVMAKQKKDVQKAIFS
ncbi:MAG: potassium channel family protein [Thermoplasmata archaeon]